MADQAAIDSVKLQLPDGLDTYGITDTIISTQIDSTTQTKTILFCLKAISAKIASIEDVSESGSSRTSRFHDRVMAMITNWQHLSDLEDEQLGNLPPKPNAKVYTIVRT